MISLSSIHPSWKPFFDAQKNLLAGILDAISQKPFNPAPELILRFGGVDLSRVQVVILGQDPYPQPGAATGRSFEVATLTSWDAPLRQASLRNILRGIYLVQTGERIPFRQVREEIREGRFAIAPPGRLWDALEAQGVLFLNAYLTCRPGEPLSHRELWQPFARALITYIDAVRGSGLSWFLWGNDARSYRKQITSGVCYESRHPMMSGNHPEDFLENPCFRETAGKIRWTGLV